MLDHELTPLQKELIKMLKWFNDFCEEKKLTYYSVGGTLLGAVCTIRGYICYANY